jgi:hypothetical protein
MKTCQHAKFIPDIQAGEWASGAVKGSRFPPGVERRSSPDELEK